MSECRSCGKPVRWAKTEKGKWMPLRLGHPGLADYDGPLYFPHWSTCPHAQAHRRARR